MFLSVSVKPASFCPCRRASSSNTQADEGVMKLATSSRVVTSNVLPPMLFCRICPGFKTVVFKTIQILSSGYDLQMNKLYYTIGQAAALLGIAVVTLRRWANHHTIPSERTLGGPPTI